MHVAINGFFWKTINSGSGQYTRNLVYTLNRYVSDLTLTLVLPLEAGEALPDDIPPSVNVLPVRFRAGQYGKVMFEQHGFPRALRETAADLAHVPYWGGPLRSPLPLVITVHDLTTMLVREYRRPFKARLYNALVAAAARGAEQIITDSHASKSEIAAHLQISEKVITPIHLAVSADYNPQAPSLMDMAIMRKYDLPDFYVLYLGGYELHKNVTTLLLAWSYVGQALGTDYPLVLAGRKPAVTSTIYPNYDEYIAQLGIKDYVKWIGFVDETDKPALYRNAESFVFPSKREGFGLPVLEAMACGAPVVTTNVTSLPEIVGDAGFTVDPEDARGMAGAIISTVIQENLNAEMRQKSAAQAGAFSWEQTAAQTLLVYDRLLGRG